MRVIKDVKLKCVSAETLRLVEDRGPWFLPRINRLAFLGSNLSVVVEGDVEVNGSDYLLSLVPVSGPRPFGKFVKYEKHGDSHWWGREVEGRPRLVLLRDGGVSHADSSVTGADIDEARRQLKERWA